MAAIQITSSNTNKIWKGTKVAVRNTDGIPYVVVEDYTAGAIEVWKGNAVSPTSFSEQDASNRPEATQYGSCSAAINDSDVISIAFMYDNGKASQACYIEFDTSDDTFDSSITVIDSDIGEDPGNIDILFTSIASTDGTTYDDVGIVYSKVKVDKPDPAYSFDRYIHRYNNVWQTSIALLFEDPSLESNLMLTKFGVPVVMAAVVVSSTVNRLYQHVGNFSNPTYFATSTVNTATSVDGKAIAETIYINNNDRITATYDTSSSSIKVYVCESEEAVADWACYDSEIDGNAGSLSSFEGDGYIFYIDATTDDVCVVSFDADTGTFGSPVTLETGTFTHVSTKWSTKNNFDSDGEPKAGYGCDTLDYAFSDGTDIYWNTYIPGNIAVGSLSKTLGTLLLDSLVDTPDDRDGELDAILVGLVISSSGTSSVTALLSTALESLALVSAVSVGITAVTSTTLANVALDSLANLHSVGITNKVLAAIQLAATGTVITQEVVEATLTATLEDITIVGIVETGVHALLTETLTSLLLNTREDAFIPVIIMY